MLFIGTLFLRLLFDFFSFAALYFLAHILFQALCRWGKIKSPCVLPLLLFSQEELEAYCPDFLRIFRPCRLLFLSSLRCLVLALCPQDSFSS